MLAWALLRATSSAGFVFNQTISADTNDYNLRAAAVAAGWNQTAPLFATVTINSGVVLSASTTAGYAFDTGTSFPVGSELKLIINSAYVCGMGGKGGDMYTTPSNAQAGGPALRAQHAVAITNNGTIAGGGGGGGGPQSSSRGGGGGRSGRVNSAGGNGSTAPGNPGTFSSGGQGGGGGGGAGGTTGEGGGGNGYGGGGGGWGARGGFGDYSHDHSTSGAYGGASVAGNSFITWLATGTRYGSIT